MSDIPNNKEDLNEMDQKPAAIPPPVGDTTDGEGPASAPVEDTNPINNPEPEEADSNNMEAAKPEEEAATPEEEAAVETFKDEEQPGETRAAEDAAAPAPSLKDPPPPQDDASNEEAGDNNVSEKEASEHDMKPPSVEPDEITEEDARKEAAKMEAGGGDIETGGEPKTAAPKQPQKEGSKREINTKFKDVQETGTWGGISTGEKVAVGVVALLVIIGVIVAVVVVLGQNDEPKEELVPPATQAPSAMATPMPAEEKYPVLLEGLQSNPVTAPMAGTLPNDPSYFMGKSEDAVACAETPTECAVSWALFTDEYSPENNNVTLHRFALASIYYSLGGPNWKNNTNWLTDASYCRWHGVNCNRLETEVEEIDLGDNGLQGVIPPELSLMDTTAVISMKQNDISGGLPGDVIAALPKLFVLYIQNNLLTGPIPDNLINEEGSLALLFIQNNNFTGPFPAAYCGDDGAVFTQFSLDCSEKNECAPDCCDPSENCY